MIQPDGDELNSGNGVVDTLAGISVRIEAEEDLTVRPHQPPQSPAEALGNGTAPGPDQLAGVYVRIDAPEDLTVLSRKASTSA